MKYDSQRELPAIFCEMMTVGRKADGICLQYGPAKSQCQLLITRKHISVFLEPFWPIADDDH